VNECSCIPCGRREEPRRHCRPESDRQGVGRCAVWVTHSTTPPQSLPRLLYLNLENIVDNMLRIHRRTVLCPGLWSNGCLETWICDLLLFQDRIGEIKKTVRDNCRGPLVESLNYKPRHLGRKQGQLPTLTRSIPMIFARFRQPSGLSDDFRAQLDVDQQLETGWQVSRKKKAVLLVTTDNVTSLMVGSICCSFSVSEWFSDGSGHRP